MKKVWFDEAWDDFIYWHRQARAIKGRTKWVLESPD